MAEAAHRTLLDPDALDRALGELPDWRRDGDALVREASLATFPIAISVVDRVAALAEQADHHPDIDIRWRTLRFRCSTHSAGGITALDLRLAAQISDVLAEAGSG